MSAAFHVASEVATEQKVVPYKTQEGFIDAMRAANLTTGHLIDGKGIEEWIGSAAPEMPIVGTDEFTSEKAVKELYRLKADQRRKDDRKRKSPGSVKKRNAGTALSNGSCVSAEEMFSFLRFLPSDV